MRRKDPEQMDAILKYVDEYYLEKRCAPSTTRIAEAFSVSRSSAHRYLEEMDRLGMLSYGGGKLSTARTRKCENDAVATPVVGSVVCGDPEEEEAAVEAYVQLPVSIFGKGDLYLLRAKGDSMEDRGIFEGDLLVIERTGSCKKGDIVVALDGSGENTLKVYAGRDKGGEYAILAYANESRYPGKVIKVRELAVQGVARHVIRSL